MPQADFNPFAAPTAVDRPAAPLATWADGDAGSLGWVRMGLGLVYAGICGLLITVFAMVILAIVVGPLASMLGMVAIFGCFILLVVGPWFCLAVPAPSGGKPFIAGAIVCQLVPLLLGILMGVRLIPSMASINIVSQILGLASTTLFIIFMRKLAEYIERGDLSARANRVLVMGIILLVLLIALGSTFAALNGFAFGPEDPQPSDAAGMMAILFLPLMIFGLVVFVMYANLINSLRKALTVE